MYRKKSNNRKSVNAKKTKYKGIWYASKLEVVMAMLLDDSGLAYEYEKSFVLFNEDTYPSPIFLRAQKRSKEMVDNRKMENRIYTPDFNDPKLRWVIEVKGRKLGAFSLRWRLFLARMKQQFNKDAPMLFMPTNKKDCIQVIDILKANFK